DQQFRGLLVALGDPGEAQRRLAKPHALRPQAAGPLGPSDDDKVRRSEAQLSDAKRLMSDIQRARRRAAELAQLQTQAAALTVRVKAAKTTATARVEAEAKEGKDLAGLIAEDRARASRLYESSTALRAKVEAEQIALAKDALLRADRRLSRLVRRARLGRIETVLGKKRALEVEIEALSQGLLPQSVVDSLDAQRYLADDEEYWPFEGEDWADEYVGGEGLR